MLLECQLGVNQHAQVTHNGRRLNDIGSDREVEDSTSYLLKTKRVPSHITSVLDGLSCNRRDAHHAWTSATHASVLLLATLTSVTDTEVSSCLSSAKLTSGDAWCHACQKQRLYLQNTKWIVLAPLWNLGHTTGDSKDGRLLAVDAEHLGTPGQIGTKPFQCGSVNETRNGRCRTSSRTSWSTVSNAALRSRRTRHVTLPSSAARMASFRTLVTITVEVEWKWRYTDCFDGNSDSCSACVPIWPSRCIPQVLTGNWGWSLGGMSLVQMHSVSASSVGVWPMYTDQTRTCIHHICSSRKW